MGWIYRQITNHNCPLPLVQDGQVGDMWQCDTPSCRQIFIIREESDGTTAFYIASFVERSVLPPQQAFPTTPTPVNMAK